MILAPSILAADLGHLDGQIAERQLDAFAGAGASSISDVEAVR